MHVGECARGLTHRQTRNGSGSSFASDKICAPCEQHNWSQAPTRHQQVLMIPSILEHCVAVRVEKRESVRRERNMKARSYIAQELS